MDSTNRRIIKMLDSIPTFETYSQYSTSLQKIFQENSFRHLLKNLKEQKKPKMYSYFNVESKPPESNNIFKAYGLENKREESDSNIFNDIDNDTKENTKKDNNISPKKEMLRMPIIKSKKRYNPELDPFRYSPNYNSIYKNIPSFRIAKPIHEKNKINLNILKSKIRIKNNKTNNSLQSPFLTEIGEKSSLFSNYSYGKNKSKSFDLLNNQSKKNIKELKKLNLKIEDKNNHSLRFDKYVDRKYVKTEVNPYISYIGPYDYFKTKNTLINFSKMNSRDDFFPNTTHSNGPTIGYYNPNYDYLKQNLRNISLGNDPRKERNKKFLLKKLWGSYRVLLDYQIVDNNKLNETGLKFI